MIAANSNTRWKFRRHGKVSLSLARRRLIDTKELF